MVPIVMPVGKKRPKPGEQVVWKTSTDTAPCSAVRQKEGEQDIAIVAPEAFHPVEAFLQELDPPSLMRQIRVGQLDSGIFRKLANTIKTYCDPQRHLIANMMVIAAEAGDITTCVREGFDLMRLMKIVCPTTKEPCLLYRTLRTRSWTETIALGSKILPSITSCHHSNGPCCTWTDFSKIQTPTIGSLPPRIKSLTYRLPLKNNISWANAPAITRAN